MKTRGEQNLKQRGFAALAVNSGWKLALAAGLAALSGCVSEESAPNPLGPPVVLNDLTVTSYDASTANLVLRGKVNLADITPVTQLRFHLSSVCSDAPVGVGIESAFESSGIPVVVPSGASSAIYLTTNTNSGCFSVITYDPSHAAPIPPTFTSSQPSSPSRTSTTPILFGSAPPTASQVRFFDDASCLHPIGAGPAANLSGLGIQVTVAAETVNSIYAQSAEPFGNTSSCTLFTTYEHSTAGPNPPVYSAITPASPSNLTDSPLVKGLLGVDAASVKIYSDPACTTELSTGTSAEFTGAGVMVTVPANSSNPLYAVAFDASARPSTCAYLTTYVYDTVAPAAPSLVSVTPPSPTKATIYPQIKGLASADTLMVKFYSNATCTTAIGAGTKALFEGVGITASAKANDLTKIYATDVDGAGNASACTFLTDYVNDTIPPDPPVFNSTLPVSPTNQSTTPLVLGNVPIDAVSVSLFKDDQCTMMIGSGSSTTFNNPGIQVTADANATTAIYGVAYDAVGNPSTCTLMTNYMHSTLPAPVPVFVQTLPASPTKVSSSPFVRGTVSTTITTVKLFDTAGCTHQIASGSRPTFVTSGIQVTLTANSTTSIYALDTDIYGNDSPCVSFTTYIHENRVPAAPTWATTSPTSPNNSSTTPTLTGTAAKNPASQLSPTVMSIFDSPVCTNRLGTGTPAQYAGGGLTFNVPADTTTSLYGQSYDAAGNASSCTYLTDYTHDSLKPGRPLFSSVTPNSPSYNQNTSIVGTLAATTDFLAPATVTIYTDAACTTTLASGTPTQFSSTGIPLTVAANATSTLYGDTVNIVGTRSTCAFLKNFLHSDVGPSNLVPTLNPNGSVTVSWNPDMIANPSPSYKLRRAIKSGGPYTIVANPVFGTSFVDKSVTQGATYYYVITAYNNTGESKDSNEASVTVSVGGSATPASLVATSAANEIDLAWSGFASSLFYRVYRSTTPGGPYTAIQSNLYSTSFADMTAVANVPYYYVVQGSNPAGESVYSNEASSIARDVPSAPTGLTVTPVTSLAACSGGPGAVLQWTASNFGTLYTVRNSYQSTTAKINIANVAGTTWTDCSPDHNLGQNFNSTYYDVVAKFGGIPSNPSNEDHFHVSTIPFFTATPGNGSVTVDWSTVGGAVSYDLYRSLKQGGEYTLYASGIATNQYVDGGVSAGTGYFYKVVANFADGGKSYFSLEAGATPGPVPTAPTNLVLTVSGNAPVLDWVAPNHYSSFSVYRASALAGPYSIVATVPTPTYTDSGGPTGRNYYYVTANWGSYETAATNTVDFRNGVPITFTATPSSTNVALSWSAVTGASSYSVKRSTSSGGPYTVLNGANATTSYTDSAVVANTGYFYVISANFADGTVGQNTAEKGAMPGTGKVPSGLTVLSTTSGTVALGWTPVPGAASYKVYKATALAGPYTLFASGITGTTKTVTGLSSGTTYYFKATSVVSGVESGQSAAVSAWTASAPGAPTAIAGNSNVDVQWTPLSGSPSFDVLRSTDGVNFAVIASGITSTLFSDSSVTNGTLYYYRITANYSGATLTSTSSNAVVPGITPVAPAGLTAVVATNGTDVTLGWAPVGGAVTYNLYIAGTSGGPYGTPAQSTSATNGVLVSGLTPGTTYYFVVTALIGTMESTYSNEIAVIPNVQPAAPVATTAGLSVSLGWSAVAGAASYDIERATTGYDFVTVATSVAATTYVDNTVLFGYPYIYRYRPRFAGNPYGPVSLASVAVTPGTQPEAPTALHAEATSTTSVSLSWIAAMNISSYRVYRGTASGGPYAAITTLGPTAVSYVDNTPAAGNTYYYVVVSVNASAVESAYSNEQAIALVNAPTGLTATAGTNQIQLNWSASAGATGYVVRRGTASGGAYGVVAANNATTAFTDTNLVNGVTYYYVVDAIFASGAVSNHSNESSATANETMNLQIPIEFTDRALSSNTTATVFQSTQTSIDTSAYDGTVTYGFEIVAQNAGTGAATVDLVDAMGTPVGSISIPGSTGSATRLRTGFTPTAGRAIYRIALPATAAAGDVNVYSARAWITQTGATKTRLYIPLLSSGAAPNSVDVSPIAQSAYTGYTELVEAAIYKRDTSVYSTIADYNPWELETVVAAAGGAVGKVALYDVTQGAVVDGTEAVFVDSTPTLVNAPFDEGATNFGSSNELESYQVSVACQSGCGAGASTIYKAGLWLSLTDLSHLQIVNRISLGGTLASATLTSERTIVDLSVYSNPTVYFQATVNPANGGSASFDLMDANTSDSGVGGLSTIGGSTLNFGTYVKTLQRSSTVAVPTNHRVLPKLTATGGNAAVSDTSIVIDATR
ncbi:MAG: fibronectin type III domain-containing protein [Bdellovibrionales bacterium]|nr:fibronectin type III domain-containing protein [Bdellovibrionales bacterium]